MQSDRVRHGRHSHRVTRTRPRTSVGVAHRPTVQQLQDLHVPRTPQRASAPERIHRLVLARPFVLALVRVVVGFLFACHGVKTLFGVFGSKAVPAFGAWPSWWAAVIQLVCGVLLVLGLGTRWAAFVASGSMAFAYFTVHAARGALPILNGGEDAALYSWVLLLFVATGPGALALDRLITYRRRPASLP